MEFHICTFVCVQIFMEIPNIRQEIFACCLVLLNTCMNTTYKDAKDTRTADAWFAANGISTKSIYVGTTEVFQAQKLATNTLRTHGHALGQNEAQTLNNFLRISHSASKRTKITQAQCYRIMNIAKQAIRKAAKLTKPRRMRV